MVDTSHSKSVRGTLSNPKTKQAMNSDKPTPRLGDHVSLKPENDDEKEFPSNEPAPTPSTPYKKAGTSAGGGDKKAVGNGGNVEGRNMEDGRAKQGAGGNKEEAKGDLPHSKKVRGTLANNDGEKVNRTQLGDPASLKAETSQTGDMGRQTEREGRDKGGRSKL
jgi:hypothetical protein